MKTIKTVFTICALFLFGTMLNAQTISTIKTGSENKLELNENIQKILGADKEGFYVLSSTRGMAVGMEEKFFVQKYDNSTLAKKWSKEFSLNISSEPFENAFFVKDKVIVLYSTWEKSDKTKTLNIRTISTNGEVKDIPTKEARIKTGMFDFAGRDFYFSFSPDSTKMLVVNKFQDKKKPEEVTTILLDVNGFKKIWEKSIPKMYNETRVISHNYRVDNSGNLFYLTSYLAGDLVQNTFCLMNSAANEPKYVDLKLDAGRISNSDLFYRLKEYNFAKYGIKYIENANEISYEFADNNQIVVTGLFKDFKQSKAGVFQNVVDITAEKSVSSKEQFFDAQIEQRINSIGKAKNSTGYDYRINKIIRQNGSLIVFANLFKIRGYNNQNFMLSDRYDDLIFVVKSGSFGWSGTLPSNTRDIGTGKDIIQLYAKNNKNYLCSGAPDAKNISGTSLEAFKVQLENAKAQKNDLVFIEIAETGVKDVTGYSTNDKKSSVLLTENFLTVNGAFLVPLTDFNNMTGSNSFVKYSLLELK